MPPSAAVAAPRCAIDPAILSDIMKHLVLTPVLLVVLGALHAGKGICESCTTVSGSVALHAELPLPELPKLCPWDAHGLQLIVPARLEDPREEILTLLNNLKLYREGATDAKERKGEWDIDEIRSCSASLCALRGFAVPFSSLSPNDNNFRFSMTPSHGG